MRYLQVLVFILAGAAVILLCVLLQQKNKALDDARASRADLAVQLEKATLRINDLTARSSALESRLNAITGRMERSEGSAAGATTPEVRNGDANRTGTTSRRRSHEEDD